MGLTALREKKTYTDKTKLNPAARDDILRSKDTKLNSIYIVFFTSDPLHCPERIHNSQRVVFFFLLYGRSQPYKCITATYLSNGPLTLLIEIVDRVSMVRLRDRWW